MEKAIEKMISLMRETALVDSKKEISNCKNLLNKCIMSRYYLNPQTAGKFMENEIKKDLKIDNTKNNTSGDGIKKEVKYEIKYSGHCKTGVFNFLQIRPSHTIDYYIFVGYNLFEENIGKTYILKVPSKVVYNLLPEYGSYAHGTVNKKGKITKEIIEKEDYEYALRPCPVSNKNTKSSKLWDILKKYEIEYKKENF